MIYIDNISKITFQTHISGSSKWQGFTSNLLLFWNVDIETYILCHQWHRPIYTERDELLSYIYIYTFIYLFQIHIMYVYTIYYTSNTFDELLHPCTFFWKAYKLTTVTGYRYLTSKHSCVKGYPSNYQQHTHIRTSIASFMQIILIRWTERSTSTSTYATQSYFLFFCVSSPHLPSSLAFKF